MPISLRLSAPSAFQSQKDAVRFAADAAPGRRHSEPGLTRIRCTGSAGSGSNRASALRALRRGNQFQQLFWIVEPFLHVLLIASQGGGGQLRGNRGLL